MAGHGLGITRWPGKRGMVRERRLDWHGMITGGVRRGWDAGVFVCWVELVGTSANCPS